MSISGPIVSEIVAQLYSENSIQTLLIFSWVDPKKREIVLAVNNEVKGVCAAMCWAFHMLCKACRHEQIFEIIYFSVSVNIHVEIEIAVQQQVVRSGGNSLQ